MPDNKGDKLDSIKVKSETKKTLDDLQWKLKQDLRRRVPISEVIDMAIAGRFAYDKPSGCPADEELAMKLLRWIRDPDADHMHKKLAELVIEEAEKMK